MTFRTVKLFADAATPEELFHGQWQGRPSKLDAFKPYLDDRWNQGCTNAWTVWEEIVPLGYQGSYQWVRAYFREKRLSPGRVTARPPSPRVVAGWILRRPETLTETEHLRLKAVLVHCPELDALTGHVRAFGQMLTERQGERLPQWLYAVRRDNLLGLRTLAAGIDRDHDAVIAGLTLPWSSGVVEGHVNRNPSSPGKGRTRTIDEVLAHFGESDGGVLALRLLRDADDVEMALIVHGAAGAPAEEFLEPLTELFPAEWHRKHEDIVSTLGKLRSPRTVPTLVLATH
ncbi:hypothetical protein [Streptomyces sp. NPDC056255]|uniref:hypothetical protein n=1 Tax=Streptomyces sp. NPDC056255 TaxID=3345764 RepID=UPI0035D8CC00